MLTGDVVTCHYWYILKIIMSTKPEVELIFSIVTLKIALVSDVSKR